MIASEKSVRKTLQPVVDCSEDVTARKAAEEALQRSERNLQRIIDTIPDLVWSAHPDGSGEFFNQKYLEYIGLSAERARGWGWIDAIHPEDRPRLMDVWQRIMASGQPGEVEARLRRYDGAYRLFLFRANPFRDESGNVIKWYGQNTDIEERKRADLLLRENEQQFKTIFDEAGVGISMVDLHGMAPIRNNRRLQTMLGCTEEELGSFATYDNLTFAPDRGKDAATFQELCSGLRDSLRLEKHFVLRDGKTIWANVIFNLLRDDDGKPRYVIAIHEDITERKQFIEKLQKNQDLLDLAQKSAGAMAFDWYIQKEINYWSPEQEALFGLAPGTFDGKYQSWKKMMYEPDWPAVVEAIRNAQATGKVTAEYRVVWPDGSLHWLSTNGRMFFDEEGKPLRMVGFTSDVSRRKVVEEELRRSEGFLAEGQHLAKLGNFSWRMDDNTITWSEQLYHIFGFDPGTLVTLELIGTRVHPDDLPLMQDMVDRAQRGDLKFEYEHRLLMPDRSVKHVHLVAHASRDEQNRLEYIGAVQDVTQRRTSEEALLKARSDLAKVANVTSLGVLTASIAHEVNQPLSGIITNASTCVRMLSADPPNIEGALETARRTIRDGNRASDVITRLRTLYSKKDPQLESIDLNDAAREVTAVFLNELQRNRVVLRQELADDLPLIVADRIQLQQVILNLVRNASDAMSLVEDRPRELVVRTERDGSNLVRLSVRDSGIGVTAESTEKIFADFYTTKHDGMGIGLSISRSIVEAHHGRLWAAPNDGPGATFSFTIPVTTAAAAAT